MRPLRYTPAIALATLVATITPALAASPTPAPTPTPTRGPTVTDLEGARATLKRLEDDIEAGESGAKRLQEELRDLTHRVADEQGTLTEIHVNLQETTERVTSTKQRLEILHMRMRERARTLYKRGPTELIGVLLGAEDLRDFIGRMSFANSLAKQDEQLVLATGKRTAELKRIMTHQRNLEQQQKATLASVRQEQDQITDVFARQQVVLAKLAEARGDALALVASIEAQFGSGEFRNLKRVAGKGMTISYDEWARGWLEYAGMPVVKENLIAMVAWEAAEGTQATWNPLATTMGMEGDTIYNDHGVRNYNSKLQGYEAVMKTLQRPGHGYDKIITELGNAVDAMDVGIAINKSDWCRGCTDGQYVIGIIPAVRRYYEEYGGG